ncbi:unnamed protein product [Protopolystoma xenopodis]|uniref:Uncharacterized protein n=1 Tax=Protopolystoma xenopodis TaxID=117903 RepID=A0A448XGH1_9PLAT|nr:unnamed protein product [Protopolystoma xenopodis]
MRTFTLRIRLRPIISSHFTRLTRYSSFGLSESMLRSGGQCLARHDCLTDFFDCFHSQGSVIPSVRLPGRAMQSPHWPMLIFTGHRLLVCHGTGTSTDTQTETDTSTGRGLVASPSTHSASRLPTSVSWCDCSLLTEPEECENAYRPTGDTDLICLSVCEHSRE